MQLLAAPFLTSVAGRPTLLASKPLLTTVSELAAWNPGGACRRITAVELLRE